MMDVEAARNLTHCFASIPALDCLGPLMRSGLWLGPHLDAARLGSLAALACACPDKIPFELRKPA